MREILLIPHERINVLKDLKTKDRIEKELNVKMNFSDNHVEIEGEGLELFRAVKIAKAVGRGFSPQKSFRLLNEDEDLEIIDLNFSDKKNEVVRSRLIGTGGRTREIIEKDSGAAISIYRKTVAIIGNYQQIDVARKAIEMIMKGSKHTVVYKYLEEHKL